MVETLVWIGGEEKEREKERGGYDDLKDLCCHSALYSKVSYIFLIFCPFFIFDAIGFMTKYVKIFCCQYLSVIADVLLQEMADIDGRLLLLSHYQDSLLQAIGLYCPCFFLLSVRFIISVKIYVYVPLRTHLYMLIDLRRSYLWMNSHNPNMNKDDK